MRRCNIFYNSNGDNKFITFSNYTEALTGNFLSTDTKMFPSRFLCINLEGLNGDNKRSLINLLTQYYENKLAVLRDLNNNNNTILSLNYLLETLYRLELIDNEWKLNIDGNVNINSEICKIVYISDIVEQDYDGTYTDTICVVNLDNVISGNIVLKNESDTNISVASLQGSDKFIYSLYGWQNESHIIQIAYNENDFMPIFDNKDSKLIDEPIEPVVQDDGNDESSLSTGDHKNIIYEYIYDSQISGIKFNDVSEDCSELTFNIIIPLFDMVDINYRNNFTTIDYEYLDEDNQIPGINLIDDNSLNNLRIKNIPLGMWFSENGVTLTKDGEYAPTWSLTISSQFKPFPYSNNMAADSSSNSKSNAYSTFAEILIKLNKTINSYESLSFQLSNLDKRLTSIESKLSQIGTLSNIDKLSNEMVEYEEGLNNKFENFKLEITDVLESLKWKTII